MTALVLTTAPVAAIPIGLLIGLALHTRNERRSTNADLAAARRAQEVADIAGRLANATTVRWQG